MKLVPTLSESRDQTIRLVRPANQRVIDVQYGFDNASGGVGTAWEEMSWPPIADSNRAVARHDEPRMIASDYIDLALLQNWIDDCENEHVETCGLNEIDQQQLLMPLLLVDTKQNCLVTVEEPVRFFALSYVWGSVNTFLTTSSNLTALSNPGALSQLPSTIPKSIGQAINLAKELGGRYLWVDALCIVQDAIDVAEHLDAMASLFSCAALTIVVADGPHANSGFKGVKGISAPRHINQQIIFLTRDRALLKPHQRHIWTDEELQPWSTRAWTFQEAICSRRLLYFAHNTVRWTCRRCRLSEESTSPNCLHSENFFSRTQLGLPSPSLSPSNAPNMTELTSLINGYNSRNLTHSEDAFNAFAGVVKRLNHKFLGGFVAGLPVMFFDLCLLWRPLQRVEPPIPRFQPIHKSTLPSWSWAAYKTEISFPLSWMRQTDDSGSGPAMIHRFRPFFTVNIFYGYDRNQELPMSNCWLEISDESTRYRLPDGWITRYTPHKFFSSHYAQFFNHNQHEDIDFWFPVAIGAKIDSGSSKNYTRLGTNSRKHAKFLFFKTTICHFRIGGSQQTATQVFTNDGKTAGTLYAHDHQDPDIVAASISPVPRRPVVTLVAIFGNLISKEDFDIWQNTNSPNPGQNDQTQVQHNETYSSRVRAVYHVLWTIEIDGVHYRKGTAVIDRAIWEEHASPMIDIVMA